MTPKWGAVALSIAIGTPAAAQDAPGVRFCPNRPSLGASGCTTVPGQVQVELSGIDWERNDDGETREDLIRSEVTARIGLTRNSEAQIGWTPLGTLRSRDKASGEVMRQTGVGDVTLGWRRALSHPDGKKLSAAVQPYVTLPVGHSGIGDGDWSAGTVLPVFWRINKKWSVDFTGQLAAAVDEDRHGRHFDATGVFGIGYALTDGVTANAELSVERDQDPAGHVARTLAAASVAWKPTKRTQLDVLAVAGLNHDAPDARVAFGGALLF
ncbi:transporter [uncultured Sphingomonas sp.]|mgnify:CR=1 FL=1|uniref:transporter n=1 Tax=uncultured Sphingomonas sp. TaxID=158754 RepID=UPI0030F73513